MSNQLVMVVITQMLVFCNFNKTQGTSGADDFGDAGTHYYEFGLQDHNESGRTLKSSGTTQVFGSNGDFVAGSIMNIAIDMDNKRVFIGKNGTYYLSANPSTPTANSTATWYGWSSDADGQLIFGLHNDYETDVLFGNFGQDSSFAGNKTAQGNQDGNDIGDFYYTPPTGFLALCTSNLPDVAVVPSEHFNTVLYTGTGGTQSITGVGFQPDFNWIKQRSSTQGHNIQDAIRGTSKILTSNATAAEWTDTNRVTSFNSDGLSLGTDGAVNASGSTYVAWNWKANGSGSSNTNGSINSTVSANVDAGFSIVSYTGNGSNATVGHGLSKAPEMIHIKNRADADSWLSFYTVVDGSLDYMYLNLTNARTNAEGISVPTSSVFSLDSGNSSNGSSDALIAYCFHSVDGYSKVGSYVGNAVANNGTFVFTGFRPKFVLIKRTNSAGQAAPIFDSARSTFNIANKGLKSNSSNAEITTDGGVDLLSNGFKANQNDGEVNSDGGIYIYLAFAETPFKYSNAR